MGQAAEKQGTKYEELREEVNEFGGLIFKLSDCKNLDSPEDLEKFFENIQEICFHLIIYSIVVKSLKIPRKLDIKMRQYLAQRFMETNSIGIFTKFLNKMTSGIFEYEGNKGNGNDSTKFDCVSNILFILTFNADADLDFAEKICEEDDLLTFFYKILDGFADLIGPDDYSPGTYKYDVVEMVVFILYNTLIHESKHNIMKMRQHKFVDIIKGFVNFHSKDLNDSNDVNVLALFFMSYVADENNVIWTAAEQKLVRRIVSLLEESLEIKNVFSSEELAKGILQLSKHDHNKLWLVNYGILDVLHQVLDKDSIEIQKTSLLILWSLAFYDNDTKKEIKKKFLEKIENMRNNLDKFVDEETETAEFLSHFNDIIHMKSESGSGIEELRQTLDNVLWVLKKITYAIKLKKCLVPLIVEKDFTPTGWLGEGSTGLPRFDMSGKCDFETSISKLKDHLYGQGFHRFKEGIDVCDNTSPDVAVATEDQPLKTVSEFSSWTESDVKKWFQKIGVTIINSETKWNGKDLEYLRKSDWERFVIFCKEELGICKLRDLRIIYEELQKL